MNKIIIPSIFGVILVIGTAFVFLYDTNSVDKSITPMKKTDAVLTESSFSTPVTVAQTTSESQPAPNITIDDSGKMFVIYPSTKNKITNLYIKTSMDNGKSFSDPVQVNSVDGNVILDGRVSPTVASGPDGQIYALWANSTFEPNLFMKSYRQLIFAQSIDGGKSFMPAVEIASDELPSAKFFQHMVVSENGIINVSWLDSPTKNNGTGFLVSDSSRPKGVKYTQSIDGGKSFMPTTLIGENPCPCCNTQIAVDTENNVYVSWRQVYGEGPTQVRDMVVASSSDGGKSFSSPVKISDDNFNFDGCVHVGAPMEVDSKGNLHTVWYTGKEGSPGIYYAISSDHGQTFSQPVPILTSDWIPPQRVYLTIDDSDTVWIAWEDSTGYSTNELMWRYGETNAMIYVAKVTSDGQIIKYNKPVTVETGKSPEIASGNGLVSIVWVGDNSVQCATMS